MCVCVCARARVDGRVSVCPPALIGGPYMHCMNVFQLQDESKQLADMMEKVKTAKSQVTVKDKQIRDLEKEVW